ncbi:MAG: energy-coupled thiamine transporter ThiT [Lachnospiraceae bacterium]|nr:energy-coupled thiamine transporter ThiT [Lachnospiraceae bacterium]
MKLWISQEGYYEMTPLGNGCAVALVVVALLVLAFLKGGRNEKEAAEAKKGSGFSVRQLVFSGVCLALAFVLSFVKIFHLPWGGSVTMLSMLFVSLVGYFYGPKAGFTAAFAYSLLQFVQGGGSYMLSPLQLCMDYFFAFTALGVSGFFANKKNGLFLGYICGILLRGLFHSIGGYLYWMDYMPEEFPQSLAVVYPIIYNYAYILLEGILTVAVLLLKPVENGIRRVKEMAVSNT